MSTPGIELLTRNGFDSVQNNRRESIDPRKESLSSQTTDERNWSWKYLRDQFGLKNMEDLYELYQQRLHRGYFSVFLLLQMLLCLAHVIVMCILGEIHDVLPDIITYLVVVILCFLLVIVTFQERLVKRYQWIPLITSCVIIVLLVLSDIGLPLYHNTTKKSPVIFRPAYGVHTLLACYIFLPVTHNLQALILGITVTLCHVVALGMFVYVKSDNKYPRLASDFMYLLSVNFLGLYFRYMNEVFIRRTFLDRRACVEATFKLECEKQQEDHLLYSILPKHIVEDVKKDIRNIFQYLKSKPSVPLQRKPFSEMYVKAHHNVSILYADVVNYSQLTVSLPPTKLVETLNELFGRFDEASEERNVLRIKFLGDCYYCVAGVPQSNPLHAKSCVDLGLDMIAIIKDVRESCDLRHGLDMRIGIHSGSILSGLVGISKWQYDIWSRDVIIANHMEQTGQPGKVHVTKQTLDLLENKYHYKPADGATRSALLQKNNIETFFIIPAHQHLSEEAANGVRLFNPRQSASTKKTHAAIKAGRRSSPEVMAVSRRRTAFMDNHLHQYQETLRKAENHMEKSIERMHLGIYDRWTCREDINPFCLTFEVLSWELPFIQQPDPLFKYYIACSLGVLIFMFLIQGIGIPSYHWIAWTGFGVALTILLFCIPLTWTYFLWNKFWDPHGDEDDTPEPKNCIVKFLYDLSFNASSNAIFRTCLYIIVSAVLSVTTLLELVDCRKSASTQHECLASWHITQTCSLVILMNYFFLRIHFQLKLIMSLLVMGVYAYGIWSIHPEIFQVKETWNPGLPPQVAHIMSLVFLSFSLHLMDRQSEYMSRLDYRWKRRLAGEQEEAETTRLVNKMLLQNILPIHVAELYLNPDRTQDGVYHEEYENVAVMFASLVDFAPDEIDGHESNEMGSLKLLNTIICDFDKILFEKNILNRVEKIKMAGWTYMAASGLDPGRRDSLISNPEEQTSEHIVPVLVKFAARMMQTLQIINEEKKHTFKLRIGISHGPVTAGVVGAQKPLYDVWGDAVNMASRMDSTGESGKIQVTEETAKILEQQGIQCEYRGPTYVKNKSFVTTYFVCLDENYEVIKSVESDTEEVFDEAL